MKYVRDYAVLPLCLCLLLSGCSGNLTWDGAISTLEKDGFQVEVEYVTEQDLVYCNSRFRDEISQYNYAFDFNITGYVLLVKGEGAEAVSVTITRFEKESQAKSYWDCFTGTRVYTSDLKIAISENIVVISDADNVGELLNLEFK